MMGTSKVIMGATLVMSASLAIVICLILVLLVELYCSFLLRRHQLKDSTAASSTVSTSAISILANTTTAPFSPRGNQNQSISPLNSAYSQGVLHAPNNFLLPCKQNNIQLTSLEIHCQEPNITPHQIGILHPTSPSVYFATSSSDPVREKAAPGNGVENLVYISNPIYSEDADAGIVRPEMTPGTFPSSDDEAPPTPPLSPMKKLPAQACKYARCLGNSGSDSICNIALSSSSSASVCTSLSW